MVEIINFWKQPTLIIESLLNNDSRKNDQKVNIILVLFILNVILTRPQIRIAISDNNILLTNLIYILLMPFLFLAFKYVFPYLIWTISEIFQGGATREQIRLIIAYSTTPLLVFLPFNFFWYIVSFANNNLSNSKSLSELVFKLFSILTFSYLIIGLRKVNCFSSGYALATLIISDIVVESIKFLIK